MYLILCSSGRFLSLVNELVRLIQAMGGALERSLPRGNYCRSKVLVSLEPVLKTELRCLEFPSRPPQTHVRRTFTSVRYQSFWIPCS